MTTRNVVLYELMSLLDFLGAVIASQDTVLLGRHTYEKWAPHWPASDMQPFADFINTTPKLVFSSTPLALDWSATTRVAEPAVDYVARLKAHDGGDIGIHGSLTLARTLLPTAALPAKVVSRRGQSDSTDGSVRANQTASRSSMPSMTIGSG